MVTSIQQMEDDMVEMNNQADTLVKTGKQNLANSDRMRQLCSYLEKKNFIVK